jgi:Fur family peroxide stress response transcriptional regulator
MASRRFTVKKQLIQEILAQLDHPTANDVYEKARSSYPQISLGTVYRNLGQMVEDGDVLRISFPGAPDRFDRKVDNHYHVICSQCGRIYDANEFEPKLLAQIDRAIEDATGVCVTCRVMRFTGICAQCRQAGLRAALHPAANHH